MRNRRPTAHRLHLLPLCAAALAHLSLSACRRHDPNTQASRQPPVLLDAADFFSSHTDPATTDHATTVPAQAATTPTPTTVTAPNVPPVPLTRLRPFDLPDPEPPDALDISVFAGPPDPLPPDARAKGETIVLDAVVGQVNGRPIFASEIFNELEARLTADARNTRDPRAWLLNSSRTISLHVNGVLANELILAEARAGLQPEIRQGLSSFLETIQRGLVSERGGSAVAADAASQADSGRTLRQQAQSTLDSQLIQLNLSEKVLPRVNVPWRSVVQTYESRPDRYNPAAKANFRLIQVPADDEAAIAAISAALESGQPFADIVAGPLNPLRAGDASRFSATFRGDRSQITPFAAEALNSAARALEPGEFAGPLRYGTRAGWIWLESIEQPPPIPLYQAQLELSDELFSRKRAQVQQRYIDRLVARGSVTDRVQMLTRLLEIAAERYGPPGAADLPPDTRPTPPPAPARPAP